MATTPASLVSEINSIYTPLLSGLSFDLNIPLEFSSVDLITTIPEFPPLAISDIPALTLGSWTAGEDTLEGNGAFDVVMKAVNVHLDGQYKKNRITASEWGKVYVQALEMALSQSASYIVAAHAAAWEGETQKRNAQLLEIQKAALSQDARTKVLETIIAKMNLARTQIDAHVSQGTLVATKVGVGNIYHEILHKEAQQNLLLEQVDAARAQTKDTLADGTPISGITATDKSLKIKQLDLVDEQIDAARAQTKNTIIGGITPVGGILGSQKALYDQQKESYIHDSQNKAVKVLSDAWTTQKTVDDAWTPPSAFLNAYIDPAIKEYISSVGLD